MSEQFLTRTKLKAVSLKSTLEWVTVKQPGNMENATQPAKKLSRMDCLTEKGTKLCG